MKLGKLLRGAVRLAKKNPELTAAVVSVAAPVAIKAAPKLVPLGVKVARVVKAVR